MSLTVSSHHQNCLQIFSARPRSILQISYFCLTTENSCHAYLKNSIRTSRTSYWHAYVQIKFLGIHQCYPKSLNITYTVNVPSNYKISCKEYNCFWSKTLRFYFLVIRWIYNRRIRL